MPSHVLIVDDHPGFRRLARRFLEDAGYSVIGEASTGAEAILEAARLKPDIVLLDIQLPDSDGFAVATSISSLARPPTIILVSSRDSSDYGPRLGGCGALGFISKADLSSDSLRLMLRR